MNIGFDLDKVFINYPPFVPSIIIDWLYKQNSNDILFYRIPKKPEQFFRLLTHYSFLRPPITKNIMLIKSFAKKDKKTGDKHYLVSSRFEFLKKRTEEIVQKYQFGKIFDEMFFNFNNEQPHLFKNELVKKLKLDRYVDDDLSLLEFLAKENPETKFFWFNKNRNGSLEKNLFAIKNLSEMFA